jgi:hypothetical protein
MTIAENLALLYFGPNIVNAAVIVVSFSSLGPTDVNGNTASRAVLGVQAVVTLFAFSCIVLTFGHAILSFRRFGECVVVTVPRGSKKVFLYENKRTSRPQTVKEVNNDSSRKIQLAVATGNDVMKKRPFSTNPLNTFYCERYSFFFDACRDPQQALCRLYLLVDVCASASMAAVSGFRSLGSSACRIASGVILVIAGLNFTYAVVIRPYRTHLDNFFLNFFAFLQLAIAGGIAAKAWKPEHTDAIKDLLGVLATIQFSVFFIQLLVGAFWAYTVGGNSFGCCLDRRMHIRFSVQKHNSSILL